MYTVTVARKPLSEPTVTANALEHATGGLVIDASRPGGRYPSNTIFTHRPGCECVGTKRVRGSQLNQVIDRGKSQTVYGSYYKTSSHCQGFTDADGMEEVPDWRCALGCPVADLEAVGGRPRFFTQIHPR